MTPEQARVFLDHIKGDRNEALFTVALTLGLRVSELIAVSWDDLNLDPPTGQRPTLTVRRGITRVKGQGLVIGDVKTKTSRRTVHLPTATAECLREHRRRQDAEVLAFTGAWPELPLGVDLVFRSASGTALDTSNVWHYLSEATQAAGLGHWHPHELRHSAGSLLLAQGVPLKMISEMLGHSSITVTADVYAPHSRSGERRRRCCDGPRARPTGVDLTMYDLSMGSDAASLLRQALALPDDEREELAAELLASLDGPDPEYSPEKAEAFAREIERRIERFANSESEGVDLATARRRVKAALSDG
jgi:hypothetical protein